MSLNMDKAGSASTIDTRETRASWLMDHMRSLMDDSVIRELAGAFAEHLESEGNVVAAEEFRSIAEAPITLEELREHATLDGTIEDLVMELCEAHAHGEIDIRSDEFRYDRSGHLTSAEWDDLLEDFWDEASCFDIEYWLADLMADEDRASRELFDDLLLVEARHLFERCAYATTPSAR